MEFSIKIAQAEKLASDCVVVGVYEAGKLSPSALDIDTVSNAYISHAIKSGDITGKVGQCLLLPKVPNVVADRILLVGLGKEKDFSAAEFRKVTTAAVKALRTTGVKHAHLFLAELALKQHDVAWKTTTAAELIEDACYAVNHLKSKKDDKKTLTKITFIVADKAAVEVAERALKQGLSIAHGVTLAKDLGNLPPNICTPTYLGEQAEKLAKDYGFKVEVLEEKAIRKLGMGSFLGVAQGSVEPPRFIVLQHLKGKKDDKPVVLVGKGITFDTGGISLKPGADMDEMKYDMCGAATVLGVFKAIGELDLAINVIGLIATCENMPAGNAIKPGDILTSMAGLTIEVLNTDAEGRLILCDALTYAERFEPAAVVDIATLTGACVIALGHHAHGLYANKDSLAEELLAAGKAKHDRAWHMPMWDDYQPQLDSNFADMANIGGRAGGSITAACFLSRFAKKYDWAHLDIAGTAWKSGKEKGGTGRPVPLLTQFLISRV